MDKNIFKEAMTRRFKKGVEEHSNPLIELKLAKESALESVEKYAQLIREEKEIDKLSLKQAEERLDAWGKCLNDVLYLEEVHVHVRRQLKGMKLFRERITGEQK